MKALLEFNLPEDKEEYDAASTEVPNEKDYHMMVAASEDLFSVANDFARKVEGLHTIDPK